MLSDFGKNNMVVGHETLSEITGYEKVAEVKACLRKQGIKFFTGKRGRVWTTLGAIELAMGATLVQHQTAEAASSTSRFKL